MPAHKATRRSSRSAKRSRARRGPRGAWAITSALVLAGAAGLWSFHSRAQAHPAPAVTAAAAATVAAGSPSPAPVRVTLAQDRYTVPGRLDLDLPDSGQAAIAVQGLGTLGSSGPTGTAQPIASVTKTMTAYLVLKDHPLAVGQDGPLLTVTDDEAGQLPEEEALHQSLVPVHAGEQFTERQALQALMLASADNMAQILAEWDAGTESVFVARMNQTAAALGMTHTHFSQPSGYLGTSTSTAPDLVKLGEAASSDPFFADLVDQSTATISGGAITNYNTLLGTDGVDGIKTGSTYWAGGCLLFSAHTTVDGHPADLVGAILGQPGSITTMLPNAFAATQDLITSTDNALERATVLTPGQTVAWRTTPTGIRQPLHPAHPVTLTAWPGLTLHFHLTGAPDQPVLQVQTPAGATDTTVALTTSAS
ncbi:D-alanyl-D-alanine carboxypeptidase family protein [Streptacidiphilus sp. MAP5-3]|uniref:D-alanyl-D-alanine carboxypeptidase family protein n=1 Tax=unclassified Streptacidiphilus TaxID=2643834 RepID=UPI00351975B0